jgi:chorismate dehydratase
MCSDRIDRRTKVASKSMGEPIRVGAVSYLNAKPLYHRLEERAPGVRLEMDLPSRLADRLARGELDVALIPSVEYLRGAKSGYEILPGFAIAARGAVRSVKLFSRVPLGRIERLALDEGSRTSQALVRVWLDAAEGVRPRSIEPLPMGVSPLESTADAVLVIGDRAMKVPDGEFYRVVDLGRAWVDLTALPFVFALWVARAGVDLGRGAGARRRAGQGPRAEAGAGRRDLLRLPDQSPELRPGRARGRRPPAVRRHGRAARPGPGGG